MEEVSYEANVDSTYSVYGFKQVNTDHQFVALWFDGEVPSDSTIYSEVDFSFENVSFSNPVYVNLYNGDIHAIPSELWEKKENRSVFQKVPVTDSPVLLIEKDLIRMR